VLLDFIVGSFALNAPHCRMSDATRKAGGAITFSPEPMYETQRLLLRPGSAADAPALLAAIADPQIVRNLSSAPWPYSLADAERLSSCEFTPEEPRLFLFLQTSGDLVGVAGLDRMPGGEMELGYWIARAHWNRGYASEAARRMVEIARTELKLQRLFAGYFVDNPASGQVLRKLGFTDMPGLVERHSRARGAAAPCRMCVLDL
jgi:RimJ/RimL family protein N-acetyltransferase